MFKTNGIDLYFRNDWSYGFVPYLCSNDVCFSIETKNDKLSYGDKFVHWVENKYKPLLKKHF